MKDAKEYIKEILKKPFQTNYINNYELRRPTRKRNGEKWLILIHYEDTKHHLFIVNETERQLLKRVKSICYHKPKIYYLNVYKFMGADTLENYGEFTYRQKNIYADKIKNISKKLKKYRK